MSKFKLESISDIKRLPIRVTYSGVENNALGGEHAMDRWNVIIDSGTHTFSTYFFTGLGLRKLDKSNEKIVSEFKQKNFTDLHYIMYYKTVKPKVADVIQSLLIDSDSGKMGFEDFCDSFGYDKDSMKAFKIHQECKVISSHFNKIFEDVDIERMRELFQDY